MQRDDVLRGIQTNPEVDVLIIGGGINGIGTFRDLAMQGVNVLLVEQNDFCSGSSAASSHMVHGGIRYLENGEFRLVREAVNERNRMIHNLPQYVRPLATTIPIFNWTSGLLNAPLKFLNLLDRPSERGALVIKVGLMMYDAYTGDDGTVPRHTFQMKQASMAKFPKINPEIVCTATYYDAAMPTPERIAIEVMVDGEQSSEQARVLNYTAAVGADAQQIILQDRLTGQEFGVKPKLVINAAGPWIDFANQALGKQTKFIGGTKGSHIVVDNPELFAATNGNEIFFENEDGRIVLIYPSVDRVIVGTTDLYIDNPDNARCTDEEVDYFISFVAKMFPAIHVTHDQIVFRYSGVRPLPASDAKSAGQVSRDHQNRIIPAGELFDYPVYNLVGGKWTSFRAFSEQVTDAALSHLGQPRQVDTKLLEVGGGKGYPKASAEREKWIADTAADLDLSEERIAALFGRYGTRAREVGEAIQAAGNDQPLKSYPSFSVAEVTYLTQKEHVQRIEDFILRRSLLAMMGRLTHPLIVELGTIIGGTLGWEQAQIEDEIAQTIALLAEKHQVILEGVDKPMPDPMPAL